MNSEDKYGIFIIESLELDDEANGRLDGLILRDILELCGILHRYYYIRTAQEFEEIIKEFKESELRYLHISCHADSSKLAFTFDDLFFYEVAGIVKDKLNNKRLFLSACKASNFEFARHIIPSSGCTSLIGTPEKIDFDKSAIFWSSFYQLMKEQNKERMGQPEIKKVLQELVNIHKVPINYFSFIRNEGKSLRENIIRPNKNIKSQVKLIENRDDN